VQCHLEPLIQFASGEDVLDTLLQAEPIPLVEVRRRTVHEQRGRHLAATRNTPHTMECEKAGMGAVGGGHLSVWPPWLPSAVIPWSPITNKTVSSSMASTICKGGGGNDESAFSFCTHSRLPVAREEVCLLKDAVHLAKLLAHLWVGRSEAVTGVIHSEEVSHDHLPAILTRCTSITGPY
jgi:hypothetical protein